MTKYLFSYCTENFCLLLLKKVSIAFQFHNMHQQLYNALIIQVTSYLTDSLTCSSLLSHLLFTVQVSHYLNIKNSLPTLAFGIQIATLSCWNMTLESTRLGLAHQTTGTYGPKFLIRNCRIMSAYSCYLSSLGSRLTHFESTQDTLNP